MGNQGGETSFNYAKGNIVNQRGGYQNIGVNYVTNINDSQDIAQAAKEIKVLLDELSRTYSTATTSDQMTVAAKAIERIESNPDWKQRVINAVRKGGLDAFAKVLDNPVGAFIKGAIEGWLSSS